MILKNIFIIIFRPIYWSPLEDSAKGIQAAPQSDEIAFERNFSFIDILQLVNEGRIIELEYHHLINPQ